MIGSLGSYQLINIDTFRKNYCKDIKCKLVTNNYTNGSWVKVEQR